MAEYDWLLSREFEAEVTEQVWSSAAEAGINEVHSDVVDRIMTQIRANKPLVERREMEKKPNERRGRIEALASVDKVIKHAAIIARRNRRIILTVGDFNTAFRQGYCGFWPICGGRDYVRATRH